MQTFRAALALPKPDARSSRVDGSRWPLADRLLLKHEARKLTFGYRAATPDTLGE